MKDIVVAREDGLVTVTPGAGVRALLQEALDNRLHVGTSVARHPDVATAMRAADPLLYRSLLRAELRTSTGDVTSPVAPRAAQGPDLLAWVPANLHLVTRLVFRADRVHTLGRFIPEPLAAAVARARELVDRGCTLVELVPEGDDAERWSVVAALPRPLPGMDPAEEPRRAREAAPGGAERVCWADVVARVRERAEGDAVVEIAAMDSHFAVLTGRASAVAPGWCSSAVPAEIVRAMTLGAG